MMKANRYKVVLLEIVNIDCNKGSVICERKIFQIEELGLVTNNQYSLKIKIKT
jgi:hypothetical protein